MCCCCRHRERCGDAWRKLDSHLRPTEGNSWSARLSTSLVALQVSFGTVREAFDQVMPVQTAQTGMRTRSLTVCSLSKRYEEPSWRSNLNVEGRSMLNSTTSLNCISM